MSGRYRVRIGLETHVQLKTKSKIFCACATTFGQAPNSQVCPVCLGYPGTLPVLNAEAVRLTVVTGLMLGARINERSRFDRKNYFYPDMPKNYQISQYDQPLCVGGSLEIESGGRRKRVGITRIHLEEDVGKSLHFEHGSGVDFNRAGTPLMEIVSEPELESADEAYAFLQALTSVLRYADVSACNLEEGNVRCDVNVSVAPADQPGMGTKAEIKNMNTFRGVHRALSYEIQRQIAVLESGGRVEQETRRWDDERGVTEPMRSKEYAHDYRYFPEPDLLPVVLTPEQIEAWRRALPEGPQARRDRLVAEYGLPVYDAGVLVADKAVADYFEEAARRAGRPKAVSNWVMTEVLRVLSERGIGIAQLKVTPQALAELVRLVEDRVINMPTAKEIFAHLVDHGGDPHALVRERGLAQVTERAPLEEWVDQVLATHAEAAADYRAGQKAALQFLIGQVMRLSRGKANPQLVAEVLRQRLGG